MKLSYTPKSLHEALTWLMGLPLDASFDEISTALKAAADAKEAEPKPEVHPPSHMILVTAINSPSEDEPTALRTLAKVADELSAGETDMIMQAAARISGAQEKEADDYGYKWRVRVVDFGIDLNDTHWTKEPLIAAIPTSFEGGKVFLLSEAQHQAGKHPFGKPPREIVGWLSGVLADDKGIAADFNILRTAMAQPLRDALVDSWERGNPNLFGLSVDLNGKAEKRTVAGKKVNYLLSVAGVTVDVVYEPAAGGKFLRMAAAKQNLEKEEEMKVKLLAALKGKNASLYASKVQGKEESITEDEIIGLLASVEGGEDILKGAQKAADDARLTACSMTLKEELRDSKLPEPVQDKVRRQFEGKAFETEVLRAAIKDEKKTLDKLTASGVILGSGDIRVGISDMENRVKMLDDFFDGKVHSFKACYANITGDEQVTGHMKAATRLRASVDSTTFAEILGDAITRRMVAEYKAAGMEEWRKIADVVPLSDFRTNRRTRMGGYGDLPAVNQGDPYNALASPGDEEATYAATKRGGTEDITIEAVKNDDAGAVRRIPVKLSRAAKRTLHKFVFDFLRANAAIYDAKALFHADHGNLGSTALAAASLTTRRQAMLKQTEAGSSEILGIPAKYLIVPVDLDKTAYDLISGPRNSDFNPTGADFTRTLQMEQIVVPYWTDTNNWFLAADKNDIPTIEIGFLDGREEPELFVQDLPNVGSMFNNDKLTYKIRHVYGGAVIDFRGLDGSVVA